ncbi:DUF7344 domain-containing protein [Halosimplex amylolyticum]|uniref:DUF7344 domain-containing protein n=1 Tax=Halosimplex amylolyticum TaxID=3396616 RepID=UPI003F54A8E7
MADATMNTNTQTASTDRIRRLIADPRRRQVLQYLIENDEEAVPIGELIAAIVDSKVPPAAGEDPIERITTELHHVHLPKLADASLADYDRDCETVRSQLDSTAEELRRTVSGLSVEAGSECR